MPHEIDLLVMESMPHFIAVRYKELLEAESAEEKIQHALQVYELGLRALALGVVSQYLIRDAGRVSDPSLNQLLLVKLPHAALDIWQQILFASLRAYGGKRYLFFMPELYDFYWDSATMSPQPRVQIEMPFTRLTQIWNDLQHGDSPKDEVGWDELCAETLALLQAVLAKFAFFANYELIRIVKRDGELYWYDNYTGLQIKSHQGPLQLHQELELGWFYLSKEKRDFLNLHPLLVFWDKSQGEPDEGSVQGRVAIYERFVEDRLYYLLSGVWDIVTDERAVTEFVRLLYYTIEQFKLERQQAERLTWWQLWDIAHSISERRMASVLGKYRSGLYLQRDKTFSAFEDFLASDKVCFILTGKSGVGKSNFLLALAEEYGREHSDVCLLMYNGAKLNPEEPLAAIVGRDFDNYVQLTGRGDEEGITNIWREIARIDGIESRKVLLCIDAINENSEAKALLRQIDELVEGSPWPWLKVVVTSRPETWRTIKRGVRLAEARYYRETGEERLGVEMDFNYSQELEPFTRDELPRAYEKYRTVYSLQTAYGDLPTEVKSALQDPLVLRLVADTYQGHEIPSTIKVEEVYQNYIDHLIRTDRLTHEDVRFLARELMPLMIREGHYANTITAREIDEARTTDGRSLFELIHSEAELSSGRRINQSYVDLVDGEILVQHAEGRYYEIGFKYERFYDYFGGRQLFEVAKERGDRKVFYKEVVKNFQDYPFLWGALRTVMVLELREGNSDLLVDLAITTDQTMRGIVSAALCEYGKEAPDSIRRVLFRLLSVASDGNRLVGALFRLAFWQADDLVPESKMAKALAIEVASLLGLPDVLERAALDPSPSVRTIAIQYVYYLWKRDRRQGTEILENLSHRVRERGRLPNVAAVESCIGISLSLLFDGYREPPVRNNLQRIWRCIIEDILFVDPDTVAQGGFSFRNWLREVILSLAIDFIVRMISSVQEDTMLTIPELSNFFEQDPKSKALLGRLAPYLDPNYGNVEEIKTDLLEAVQGYDVLTLATVWRSLIAHGVQHFSAISPLLDELFENALMANPFGPYAQAMLNTLVFILEDRQQINESDLQRVTSYMEVLYDTNGFKFRLAKTSYRISYIDFYIHLFYRKYGHLDSPFLLNLFERAKTERDTEFLVHLINSTLSSLRHLGITFEAPKLALGVLGLVLDYDEELVREAIIDMIARMKVYYPEEVDDFLAGNDVAEDIIMEVRRRKTTETINMLIENKAYFFLNDVLLESQTVRDEFIELLQIAVETENLNTWLKVLFKRVVNLVYGDMVFQT